MSASRSETNPVDHDADVRTRLLAAAGPVFASHGFERATVRDICGAADVNVASVAYYFGDKMGLYREVIQQVKDGRERRFPAPNHAQDDPQIALYRIVHTMLSRMLVADETGWETQLLMREMDQPTAIFSELVNDFFRPLFNQLSGVIECLVGQPTARHTVEQLTLSVVGQCLYYRVGGGVVQILIPESRRNEHYGIESLSRHITAVTLSATSGASVTARRSELERKLTDCDLQNKSIQTAHPDSSTESQVAPGNTRHV